MSTAVAPGLRKIMAVRGRHPGAEATRIALALAVLTGLAAVADPAPALAEFVPTPTAQVRIAAGVTPHRPDEAMAKSFESALGSDAKDAALLRAVLAERVAAKRVVLEAMRAGLSTEVPDASVGVSPKGLGVPLRDVRPIEYAVDASYDDALRADPTHVDLIGAVKAQRDAEAEVRHQSDLIAGVVEEDEPEAPTLR